MNDLIQQLKAKQRELATDIANLQRGKMSLSEAMYIVSVPKAPFSESEKRQACHMVVDELKKYIDEKEQQT